MLREEGWTKTFEGKRLFWRRHSPEDDPEGVMLIVHGLAEHSGRYLHVLDHFANRGFDCWAGDYRGHGKSPGRRVHVNRFDDYLADVETIHRLARRAHPDIPLVLLGHSQGGLITLRYTLAHPEDLARVIVSSPFLGIHPDSKPNAVLRLIAGFLSAVSPRLMLSQPPDASLLSHDPAVGEAYLTDPLVSSSVSTRWFTEVTAAHRDTLARAGELSVPLLVMQSGDDRLADPAATRAWVEAAPNDRVEYVELPGFYHEMFNELEQHLVFEQVERWLRPTPR